MKLEAGGSNQLDSIFAWALDPDLIIRNLIESKLSNQLEENKQKPERNNL